MRLWWVSMSLFMELEGELGLVLFSCCSSNGIPHWLMRFERSEELVVVSSSFTSTPPPILERGTWWTRWSG